MDDAATSSGQAALLFATAARGNKQFEEAAEAAELEEGTPLMTVLVPRAACMKAGLAPANGADICPTAAGNNQLLEEANEVAELEEGAPLTTAAAPRAACM